MKSGSGWKSEEFWATAAHAAVSVLVASGLVGPNIADGIGQAIVTVGGLVAAALPVLSYSIARLKHRSTVGP